MLLQANLYFLVCTDERFQEFKFQKHLRDNNRATNQRPPPTVRQYVLKLNLSARVSPVVVTRGGGGPSRFPRGHFIG